MFGLKGNNQVFEFGRSLLPATKFMKIWLKRAFVYVENDFCFATQVRVRVIQISSIFVVLLAAMFHFVFCRALNIT